MKKNRVLVVLGSTAVGKTALGIKLAQKFNGEIISADALQVYRDLDIGTAKATLAQQRCAVHHLIDVLSLAENYSVADFKREAETVIKILARAGKLPIVVGGSGLYIQALLDNFSLGGEINNSNIRLKYEELLRARGPDFLWQLLREKDSKSAEKIDQKNFRRVVRALEVFENTGKSIANFDDDKVNSLYDSFLIGLNTERAILYERINERVAEMFEQGLLREAELLFKKKPCQASQGIGYKEFFPYFAGEVTLCEAIEKVKQNSRRFAKRQLTWFNNRMPDIHWYDLIQNTAEEEKIFEDITTWIRTREGD